MRSSRELLSLPCTSPCTGDRKPHRNPESHPQVLGKQRATSVELQPRGRRANARNHRSDTGLWACVGGAWAAAGQRLLGWQNQRLTVSPTQGLDIPLSPVTSTLTSPAGVPESAVGFWRWQPTSGASEPSSRHRLDLVALLQLIDRAGSRRSHHDKDRSRSRDEEGRDLFLHRLGARDCSQRSRRAHLRGCLPVFAEILGMSSSSTRSSCPSRQVSAIGRSILFGRG